MIAAALRRHGKTVHVTVFLLSLFAIPGAARAGTILVSGDSNITDILGGANTNTQFFLNVLGTGTTVGVLDFTNASFGSASNTDVEVNSFYDGLVGVTSSLVAGTVTDASLAGVNLFVAPTPDDDFTAGEIQAFANFLSAGGTLFLLGENNNAVFATANGAINQLLNGLGSAIDLVPGVVSPPGSYAVDPFTAGLVGDMSMPAGSQITGGKILYTTNAGAGLISRQDINTVAPVPEPATLLLLGSGIAAIRLRRKRK